MSWHGPSAPRVEGIATKSRVVASCASKPASTASRIFRLVSLAFIRQAALDGVPIKPYLPDLQAFLIAFRIAAAPIHCAREFAPMETRMPGNRNILYLIIGALIVAVGVLGYNLYQTKKEPEGLQINVGPNGLKIQNK